MFPLAPFASPPSFPSLSLATLTRTAARGQAAIHAVLPARGNRTWPDVPANWQYGSERADIALLFPKFFREVGACWRACDRTSPVHMHGCP